MEMPKDCPIRIILYPNGQVVKANAIDYEEFESVYIPSHGRLIDADALLESIKEARKKDPEIEDVYIDDYFTVAEWVVSAPTIIEGDGE